LSIIGPDYSWTEIIPTIPIPLKPAVTPTPTPIDIPFLNPLNIPDATRTIYYVGKYPEQYKKYFEGHSNFGSLVITDDMQLAPPSDLIMDTTGQLWDTKGN